MTSAAVISETARGSSQDAADGGRCTYCGLPVNAGRESNSSPPAAIYCCYGCRFAHAVVQEKGNEGAIRWTVVRLGLAIFFTMNLMAFTMTMWSLDVYDVKSDPFQLTLYEVFRWLSMVFALPVLLLLGVPLLQNAFSSWQRRVYSTDLLIGLAVFAAYVTSVINVVRGTGTIYFEVGAMVLVMVTLGRWIEAAGKQKATEALDELLTLLPEHVSRVRSDGGVEESVVSSAITIGDQLRIRAGERFPTDAVIERGSTTVDEQVFTGESIPVQKAPGDPVLAGTVNLDGDLAVRVTAAFREGSFGRLLSLLKEARNARGYYQRLADRVAAWFFPIVTLVAISAFAWHLQSGVGAAIQTAMSVLLIACPCALGLATPLAVWTALSTAIRHQVLFRSGEAVERLADVNAICMDKTGTLTTGNPHVCQTAVFGEAQTAEALQLSLQLAESSSHPFAQAVARYARSKWSGAGEADIVGFQSMRTISGGGVEAIGADGRLVRLGSVEFSCCDTHAMDCQRHSASAGHTFEIIQPNEGVATLDTVQAPDLCVSCKASVPLGLRVNLDRLRMAADQAAASIVLLTVDRVPAIGFLISESIRPEAGGALKQLSATAEVLHVLSGDRPAKGRFLRDRLQVPDLQVECNLNPEQKVQRVAEIRRSHGTTVMVGDGINDAPALAASDVGIAMGCGADVSRDSAQVCLLSNDLTRIPWAIGLARRTQAVIRQNLFWAFGYNAAGVALAATGILNPAIAAGLMIASSLLVISNSLRLLRDGRENKEQCDTGATPGKSGSLGSGNADVAANADSDVPVSQGHANSDVKINDASHKQHHESMTAPSLVFATEEAT